MNTTLRVLAAALACLCSNLFASDLSVNLSPSTARWRVDAGGWCPSGFTLYNLAAGSHVIEYDWLNGYAAPAPETVTLGAGANTFSRSYTQLAQFTLTLTPAVGRWRLDGGAWNSGGGSLYNLTPGSHLVEYDWANAYAAPPSETVNLVAGANSLTRSYTALAHLTVNVSPSTGRWRMDGGGWQSPGASFYNIPTGSHLLEYYDQAGLASLPPETVTLAAGFNTLSRTLVAAGSTGQITVTLTPGSGQWRVDGGAWQASGATVAGLAAGSHTLNYNTLAGYTAPATESVSLSAGQSLSLNRSYTVIPAQLTVTLTPGSGQWRVDGGAWQASGATVSGLSVGSHAVDYNSLTDYVAPVTETVTLAAAQSLSLSRSYTAAAYTWVELGTLGGSNATASAINLAGRIAGTSTDATGQYRAFRYTNGTLQNLGTIGSNLSQGADINEADTVAGFAGHAFRYGSSMEDLGALGAGTSSSGKGINNAGTVVGFSYLGTGQIHAFTYSGGAMTDLGTLGGSDSIAYEINDAGVIVGGADLAGGEHHAFRYVGGVMQDLGASGSTSEAYGINEAGVIVGVSGGHAFRYSGGVMTDLGTINGLAGSGSAATDINEAGDIVGYSNATSVGGIIHGFIYRGGVMQDLNSLVSIPGIYVREVGGINDLGQIAVIGSDSRSYLLTPVNAPGGVQVDLAPATAQWRVDGGVWQAGGAAVLNLTAGSHAIEYNSLSGYTAPASEIVAISSGRLTQVSRSYTVVLPLSGPVTWAGTGTNFATGANWVGGFVPQDNFTSNTAVFTGNFASAQPVLATNRNIKGVLQDAGAANDLSLTGAGLLRLGSDGIVNARPTGTATFGVQLVIPSGTVPFEVAGGATTILTGPLSGIGGSLTKTGAGALQLLGSTSLDSVSISAGTLYVGNGGTITSDVGTAAGTTFTYDVGGASFVQYRGVIYGAGVLRKTGSGTLQLAPRPTGAKVSSIVVEGGTLDDPGRGLNAPALVVEAAGTLAAGDTSIASLSGAGQVSVATILEIGLGNTNAAAFSGTISGNGAVQTGGGSTVTLSGPNTWTGPLTVRYGSTLSLGAANALPLTANVSLPNSPENGTINLNGFDQEVQTIAGGGVVNLGSALLTLNYNNADTVFSGTVTGSGGITKKGTRTLTLTGANTYGGGTQIAAGAILANNTSGSAFGTGAVVVNAAAALGGSGSFTGALTLNGQIAPGNSAGALTTGAATWNGGSSYLWEITDGAAAAGAGWDTVTVAGALALNATPASPITIRVRSLAGTVPGLAANFDPNLDHTYVLASAGSISGFDAAAFVLDLSGFTNPSNGTWSVEQSGASLALRYRTAPPQPRVTITLTPGTGQWRIDGGAWQASGATVTGLSVGSHTVEYNSLAGYTAPATETVTLSAGQALSLSRSYTVLPAQLTITLTPSTGQWRVDAGAWQASGATVTGLGAGNHTVEYNDVVGYTLPPTETVTLSAGQSLSLSRSYTALPAQLTITLTPSAGQWRVDGGAWRASGATVNSLTVGNHTVEYNSLAGYTPPPTETVALTAGQSLSLSRSYTLVSLTPITWAGTGTDFLTGSNWIGGVVPANNVIDNIAVFTGNFASAQPVLTSVRSIGGLVQESGTTADLYLGTGGGGLTVGRGGIINNKGSGVMTLGLGIGLSSGTIPLHVAAGGQTLLPGMVGGAGSFDKTGGGTAVFLAVLGSANTTVSAGTLQIGNGGVDGTLSGDVAVAAGGNLVINRSDAGFFGLSGKVTGAGTFTKSGSSSMLMPPGQTIKNVVISAGKLYTTVSGNFDTPNVTVQAGGTLDLVGETIESLSGAGQVALHSLTINGTTASTFTFSGSLTGSGNLTKTGPSTLVLSGTNPMGGTLSVNGGVLSLGAAFALPSAAFVSVSSAGTINLNNFNQTVGTLGGFAGGTINLGSATLTSAGQSSGQQFAGTMNGSGGFIKLGADLRLSSSTLNFTGPLQIASGSLTVFAGSNCLPAGGSLVIDSLGSLVLNTSAVHRAGALSGAGPIDLKTSRLEIGSINTDTTYSGVISGTGGTFHKLGTGTLALTGASTYTGGTRILAGTLLANNPSGSAFGTGAMLVDAGATLGGSSGFSGALTLNGRLSPGNTNSTGTLTTGSAATWNGGSSYLWDLSNGTGAAGTGWDTATVVGGTLTLNATPASPIVIRLRTLAGSSPGLAANFDPFVNHSYVFASATFISGFNAAAFAIDSSSFANPLNGTWSVVRSGGTLLLNYQAAIPGQLTITLTPGAGQWSVDGGPLQASGATVSVAAGSHFVGYASLSGYDAPSTEFVTISAGQSLSLSRSYTVQTSQLTVNLTPGSGQWRVDGGAWRNSGTTASGLAIGSHTVEYSSLAGYFAPSTETVTLTGGTSTTISRTYSATARLTVTLGPPFGHWYVDGTAYLTGVTATGLAPGLHTLTYQDFTGWTTPPSETVTLVAGQTLALTRTYGAQPAQLTVTLTPGSGQWRVDGGAWQASGATVPGLTAPGSHTIEYNGLPGYFPPPTETLSFNSGESKNLARTYGTAAQITVNLTPASGQWRVDGGEWQAGGATLGNLSPSSHVIQYAALSDYVSPANDTVTLTSGQSLVLNRAYSPGTSLLYSNTPISGAGKAAAINNSGVVVGSGIGGASRVYRYTNGGLEDLGALGSGIAITTGLNDAGVIVGFFLTAAPGYDQHAFRFEGGVMQDLGTLGSGRTSAAAAINSAGVIVGVAEHPPAFGSQAMRYQAGAMEDVALGGVQAVAYGINDSGIIVGTVLAADSSSQAVRSQNGAVTVVPGLGGITASARGINNAGVIVGESTLPGGSDPHAFRYDGTATQDLGTLGGARSRALAVNSSGVIVGWAQVSGNIQHAFVYRDGAMLDLNALVYLPGVVLTEAVDINDNGQIVANDSDSLPHILDPLTTPGSLRVDLTPATGQWRVDGGAWQASGATVTGLTGGGLLHTVEYSSLATYTSPATETVAIGWGQTTSLSRSYTLIPAQVTVTLTPAAAQWRVDGGAWQASGATATGLTPGIHNLEYNSLAGYNPPPSEAVNLTPGQSLSLSRTYTTALPQLTVTLTPATGQWRLDTDTSWRASGTTINLPPGTYVIYYAPLTGYNGPINDTVPLASAQTLNLARSYTLLTGPASYTAVKIEGLGGPWGYANRINNSSAVAGFRRLGGSTTHAYRYSGGVMQDLGTFGGTSSASNDINAAGTITGYAQTAGGQSRAFVATGGTLQDLGTLGGSSSSGLALNDAGVIVGSAATVAGNQHAFRYEGGSMVDLGTLGGSTSRAYGINLAGMIVGEANTATTSHAFAFSGGTMQDLGTLGGSRSIAFDINDAGTVVGAAEIATGAAHAFAFSGGTMQDLGTLGAQASSFAAAINNLGTVVGYAYTNQTADLRPFISINGVLTDINSLVSIPGVLLTQARDINDLGQIIVHGTDFVTEVDFILTPVAAPYASLQVNLSPAGAQWRVDGGSWQASGAIVSPLAPGMHTVEYNSLPGYFPPATETVSVAAGQSLAFSRAYTPAASLSVTLTPASGEWRIDGGAWQASGATATGLAAGSHTVEYNPLSGYTSPATETVSLAIGQSLSLSRSYTPIVVDASVNVTFSPAGLAAQWRIDGGAWQFPATTLNNVSAGVPHTVEFSAVEGYVTAAPQTFTLLSGELRTLTPIYEPLASVNVIFNPGGIAAAAQWRLDGGPWQFSATTLNNLAFGVSHTVEFSPVEGYVTAAPQTFTLLSGELRTLTPIYEPLASVNVIFNPGGIAAAAQWRLDGGAWQVASTTLNNLAFGVSHTVEFSDVAGYVTAAPQTFTLLSGELRTLTPIYQALASVHVNFNPGGVAAAAQWRLDGGAWQVASTTLNNLSFYYSHTVEFSPVPGYITPPPQTFTLSSGESKILTASYAPLAAVNVTFSPAGIPAQWRLDGGEWQLPATTLNNVDFYYPHTVDFLAVPGYITPASETFTLASGELRTLTPLYEPSVAQLTVNLTPASGQWRVDGGAWQASGATVTGLTDGSHTVEYGSLAGYASPATETITTTGGKSLSLNRSYIVLVTQLTVTLTPGTAQWRVDSGAWQASGATVIGLTAGSHTVEYNSLAGYSTPAAETVALTAGQSLSLSRSYTALPYTVAQVRRLTGSFGYAAGINLAGSITGSADTYTGQHAFRQTEVLGGTAMEDLGTLGGSSSGAHAINDAGVVVGNAFTAGGQVHAFQYINDTLGGVMQDLGTLGGSSSDANAINASGVIVGQSSLASPGLGHAFRYSGGTMQDLGTLGGSASRANGINDAGVVVGMAYKASGSYHAFRYNGTMQDLGVIGGPGSGLSEAYAINASGVIVGYSHTAEPGASHAFRYSGGVMQDLGALAGDDMSYAYAINGPGEIVGTSLNFANSGPMRAFVYQGGALQDLNTLVSLPGVSLEQAMGINDFGQIVAIGSDGRSYVLTRTDVPGGLQLNLTPAGQWRVDGGAWQASGTPVVNLAIGGHVVEYNSVPGYVTPPTETIAVPGGRLLQEERYYTTAPGAHLAITLAPTTGEWRVDGGAWQASGATVTGLTAGSHTVEYNALTGYVPPAGETVTLATNQHLAFSRTYVALPAQLTVTLTPGTAQWRVDGGALRASGTTAAGLAPGNHTVSYGSVSGYSTPAAETVTLAPGESLSLSRSYTTLPTQITVNLTPSSGQWRIDGGAWRNSTSSLIGLAAGSHTIEYSDLAGYIAPATETVTLNPGVPLTLNRSYTTAPAQLSIALTPGTGQWRVDSGAWQNSGATVTGLAVGSHTVEYNALSGYTAPATETVALTAGQSLSLSRTYTAVSTGPTQLTVTLSPATARWRIDAGGWCPSGFTLYNLATGPHLIEYDWANGYAAPPSETFTVVAGTNTLTRSYTQLAQFTLTLSPAVGRWRMDGGAWNPGGGSLYNLAPGSHSIEYDWTNGYAAPAPETVTLAAGTNALTRSYTALAHLTVNLTPSTGRWRMDGGGWQSPGASFYNIPTGPHLIEYYDQAGATSLPPETVTLSAGFNTLTRALVP